MLRTNTNNGENRLLTSIVDLQIFKVILYFSAFLVQSVASFLFLFQIKNFKVHRFSWILMSLALALTLSRLIGTIIQVIRNNQYPLSDAVLAFFITLLFLITVIKLGKLFAHVQQQEQKFEQMAKFDFLTGALSRYAIMDQSALEIERSIRLKKCVAILLIDIDKFKSINDIYGHAAGDFILVQFTNLCKKSLRQIDLFARYGGDEFLSVFPQSNLDEIKIVACRLKDEVRESIFNFNDIQISITASIGIAFFNPIADSYLSSLTSKEIIDELIKKADLEMYRFKNLMTQDNHALMMGRPKNKELLLD